MKALYDREEIEITQRFINALKEVMAAECEMMAANEPDSADCWTWGVCEINDLSHSSGLSFEFGGEEDKPEYATEKFTVISNL